MSKGLIAIVAAAMFFVASGALAAEQIGNQNSSGAQNNQNQGYGYHGTHRGYGYFKNH